MSGPERPGPLEPEASGPEATGAEATGAGLDDVFGESAFRDYGDEPLIAVPRRDQASSGDRAGRDLGGLDQRTEPDQRTELDQRMTPAKAPRGPIPKNQQVLMWVAGGLVAVLLLVALYFLGTRLGAAQPEPVASPSPTPSETATPTPEPTALPAGPVSPGTYDWQELLGGECLEPFADPWAEEFTVVDCGIPHRAQLVDRGTFTDLAEQAYPGAEALQSQINLLCTGPSVIDLAAAGQFADIQVQATYAATAEEWDAGHHDYFCFVSRSSGEPLPLSVGVPGV
ncbi:hypothetical protein [Diaminobutyricimonas sp. TR449]|uniref:hypothetical protein n=1 Tax=Diaminobutyricimonas sp. TR449 TaxID=2708076 RepID=UPI0014203AA2|nr:hypothetical protein [Diaminobutyricimonas sp. TR449]